MVAHYTIIIIIIIIIVALTRKTCSSLYLQIMRLFYNP